MAGLARASTHPRGTRDTGASLRRAGPAALSYPGDGSGLQSPGCHVPAQPPGLNHAATAGNPSEQSVGTGPPLVAPILPSFGPGNPVRLYLLGQRGPLGASQRSPRPGGSSAWMARKLVHWSSPWGATRPRSGMVRARRPRRLGMARPDVRGDQPPICSARIRWEHVTARLAHSSDGAVCGIPGYSQPRAAR